MDCYNILVNLLKEKQLHISCAESCTGGMLSSSIIDVAGASAVIESSYVTYSVRTKCSVLGVSLETVNKFGVVSEQVAAEMAQGAAKTGCSEIGVGITGLAGPDDCDGIKAGTVCFGFSVCGKVSTNTVYFSDVKRNQVRKLSCDFAAKKLCTLISSL